MSSPELQRKLIASQPSIPVISVTAHGDEAVRGALRAGRWQMMIPVCPGSGGFAVETFGADGAAELLAVKPTTLLSRIEGSD